MGKVVQLPNTERKPQGIAGIDPARAASLKNGLAYLADLPKTSAHIVDGITSSAMFKEAAVEAMRSLCEYQESGRRLLRLTKLTQMIPWLNLTRHEIADDGISAHENVISKLEDARAGLVSRTTPETLSASAAILVPLLSAIDGERMALKREKAKEAVS